MENTRKFYGDTIIDYGEYNEMDVEYKIELSYYKTINNETDTNKYGIEVVKKELKEKYANIETKKIINLTDKECKVDEILNVLKSNLVTPIGLTDVLEDMAKKQIYDTIL